MKTVSENGVLLVSIPEYIHKTLDSKGVSLAMLGDKLGTLTRLNDDNKSALRQAAITEFYNFLKDQLSLSDINDLLICNSLVDDIFYGTSSSIGSKPTTYAPVKIPDVTSYAFSNLMRIFENNSIRDGQADFINYMSNKDVDLNGIIMNNDHTKVVELVKTQYVLFVIIKSGFTNIIRFKNTNFVSYFRKLTLNSMFNAYGDALTTNHALFLSYLRLTGN